MPRNGQIIPEYLHPHVKTYINDNTTFQETISSKEASVSFINVIASEKGRDGMVVECNSLDEYISEFGKPRYDLYGQPCLMPYASLSSGQAKCWVLRVMPEDATYANMLVVAKVKVGEKNGVRIPAELPAKQELIGNKTLLVKHEVIFFENLKNADDFNALAESVIKKEELKSSNEGWKIYPLFGFVSAGRGAYGNNYRVRITNAPQADKDNIYKNFKVELLELANGLVRKDLFQGSLDPVALDGNKSLFLEDLVNDTVQTKKKIEMYMFAHHYNSIFELYKKEVEPTTTLDLGTFDIITGVDKTGHPIPNILIQHEEKPFFTEPESIDVEGAVAVGSVSLGAVEGVSFAGGTDGSFDINTESAKREEAIKNAYIKAFKGEFDKALVSKRRTPADFILDANYPAEVKTALVELVNRRYDAQGMIDAGILNTTSDLLEWAEKMSAVAAPSFTKEGMHYKIRDPFTGKIIPVTITYLYAQLLPNHVRAFGRHTPFVGETFTKVTGAIKNSVRPIIDVDDEDLKEKLYENRVNYYECTAENTFIRATQSTAQTAWSDLSEQNNMLILLEIKRKIEDMVYKLNYKFSEASDRKDFTDSARRMFLPYLGNQVRDIDVSFQMNNWEEERSILHCYLTVQFKSLSKRGIIEIDINKRV